MSPENQGVLQLQKEDKRTRDTCVIRSWQIDLLVKVT